MSKPELDLKNINVGFVITGLLGMVEDDGLVPREAFELVDEIKRQTYFALREAYMNKVKK
ncbi:hypothetical protein V7150_16205 [Neobacillus drentensis]|uniref:hypothetical protein n=1 Tax=Neobacillus drentensis TaxID=220684 RepID=UPI0030000224